MNTTHLIQHWNMSGAGRELAGRFRSGSDVGDEPSTRAQHQELAHEGSGLLVKQAGEDVWAPLGTD